MPQMDDIMAKLNTPKKGGGAKKAPKKRRPYYQIKDPDPPMNEPSQSVVEVAPDGVSDPNVSLSAPKDAPIENQKDLTQEIPASSAPKKVAPISAPKSESKEELVIESTPAVEPVTVEPKSNAIELESSAGEELEIEHIESHVPKVEDVHVVAPKPRTPQAPRELSDLPSESAPAPAVESTSRDFSWKLGHTIDLEVFDLDNLGENNKRFLVYLFQNARSRKSFETGPIRKPNVVKELEMNPNTLKSCHQRLVKVGILRVKRFLAGKAGFTVYEIHPDIYDHIAHSSETVARIGGAEVKVGNSLSVEIPRNLKAHGFNAGHISQLKRQGLTNGDVQKSLDAFSFDMQNDEFAGKVRSPAAFFFKIMKEHNQYVSSMGYVSPEDQLLEQMLFAKEKKLQERRELEGRLMDAEFEEWVNSVSPQEIEEACPSDSFEYLGDLHRGMVKTHFKEVIWPLKKPEALIGLQ